MLRLVCAFVVRKQRSHGCSRRGPIDDKTGLRLCCSQVTKSWFVRVEANMTLRLVCTFVVRKQRSQGFSRRGPYDVEAGLRLCCSQATKSGVFASRPF